MIERTKPVEILLVEDNAGDVRLMREAFATAEVNCKLASARDGVEALAYLRREGDFAGVSRPDLVLLDLNLPRKDGQTVLAEMKADPALRRIPVVVLTGSRTEADILRVYNLNVNSYITKPSSPDGLLRMVRGLQEFWLTVVKLPKD